MPTASDLINRTKNYLLANVREERNTLAAPYTTGVSTTLTFTYGMGRIVPGAIVQVDLELFLVLSVAGQVATVLGAQNGSTGANHAQGTLTVTDPHFYDFIILQDINSDLDDLTGQGMFQEKTLNIPFNAVVSGYDLVGATTVLDVLEVRYKQYGPSKRWPLIRNYSLLRDMDPSEFPSTFCLIIDRPGFPGLPIRVRYSAPFTYLVNLTDDVVSTTGLPATATDLPAMGAALRQMAGREIKRSFTEAQPDTRRASEVPPGAATNSIRNLQVQRQVRIQNELERLIQRFPPRVPQ